MPPQQPVPPTSQPGPNPQYDFILKDPSQNKKIGGLPKMPKPIVMLGGAMGVLFIIIIFAAILGGSKGGNGQNLIAVVGKAQEIGRVSTEVQQESQDANTRYLAATTVTALSSEQYQLTTYLASHSVKISPAQLALYTNKTTDTQLQSAKQNNSLESTYDSYLQTAMTAYQQALITAAKGASTASLALLNNANSSAKVILAAPELSTASSN